MLLLLLVLFCSDDKACFFFDKKQTTKNMSTRIVAIDHGSTANIATDMEFRANTFTQAQFTIEKLPPKAETFRNPLGKVFKSGAKNGLYQPESARIMANPIPEPLGFRGPLRRRRELERGGWIHRVFCRPSSARELRSV